MHSLRLLQSLDSHQLLWLITKNCIVLICIVYVCCYLISSDLLFCFLFQIFCTYSHTCLGIWTSLSTRVVLVGKSENPVLSLELITLGHFYVCCCMPVLYGCRYQRARPIIIDPGLYHSKKSDVFWAKEKRSMPASFKLFMGTVLTFALISVWIITCSMYSFFYPFKAIRKTITTANYVLRNISKLIKLRYKCCWTIVVTEAACSEWMLAIVMI